MDPATIEGRLRSFFDADPRGAVAAYLFGGVARGDAGASSDVDVGVLFAADPPASLGAPQFALEADLERLLHAPVQVVALNRASADLVHRVLRDDRLVLDCDRAARIRFEVHSRNQYFDMAQVRRALPTISGAGALRVGSRRGAQAMTDAELVAKKLAFIETCVRELRTLARPELIAEDVREQRFVEHTLQLAIQAALDVGSHMVSDDRWASPRRAGTFSDFHRRL